MTDKFRGSTRSHQLNALQVKMFYDVLTTFDDGRLEEYLNVTNRELEDTMDQLENFIKDEIDPNYFEC